MTDASSDGSDCFSSRDNTDYELGIGLLTGASLFQVAGLVLMIVGLLPFPVILHDQARTTAAQGRSPRLYVLPGAGSSPLGATLGLVHF